jgi:hypothetical protein
MFSAGSSSVISLAIVTPSLQTMGTPKRFSISTHFDLGPSVTRTASASAPTPRRILSRAADPNSTCLCVMWFSFDSWPSLSSAPEPYGEDNGDRHRGHDHPLIPNRLHHDGPPAPTRRGVHGRCHAATPWNQALAGGGVR